MRRHSHFAIGYLVLLFGVAAPCYPATIFSNFAQPGYQYGPDSVGVGAIPVPGIFLTQATNFSPFATAQLTNLDLPLAVVGGPTEIEVQLLADSAGQPGALIEAFHLTGLPFQAPTTITPVFSVLHPTLNEGTQYWVSVTGGTPSTFAFWGLTVFPGHQAAGGATRTISNGVDLGWIVNPGTRMGALSVNGEAAVPEPRSAALLAGALCLFCWLKRSVR